MAAVGMGVIVTVMLMAALVSCDRRDSMHSRKTQPQASSRLRSAANATSSSATTKRDSLAAELERGPSLLCRLLIPSPSYYRPTTLYREETTTYTCAKYNPFSSGR